MSESKEKYLIPLTIELNKCIETEVYFLKLPLYIKEKLIQLEELSKSERNNKEELIQEKYNLPLNSLKKMLISYLPGVCDMKGISINTDENDDRWLIATEKINTNLVVKIFKIWIENFYIKEIEENKKTNNEEAIKFAKQLIEEVLKDPFEKYTYSQKLVLFDNGEVMDKDAFSLFPLVAVNNIIGTDIVINGKKSHWMYSNKNEIVTDPLSYKDEKEEDYFSFVATFSVQTLPPFSKPYLNIKLSSRRWISKNESGKEPFYQDRKSVYIRIDNNKLQKIRAKYNSKSKQTEWIKTDIESYYAIYKFDNRDKNIVDNELKYIDIITEPKKFMNGRSEKDIYIPFEYGMKDENRQMHNQEAGITHMDRCELFKNIMENLKEFSSEIKKAIHVAGNDTILKSFFDEEFQLLKKGNLIEEFQEMIKAICGREKMVIEVCYSSGQEDLRNELIKILEKHLINTNIEIKMCNLRDLTEGLEYIDDSKNKENGKKNLKGYNKRIEEIKEKMGMTSKITISIIIIHQPSYYKLENREDKRVDPKNALRVGFANTGRLTQFITIEAYKEAEKKRLKSIENKNGRNKDGKIKKTYAFNMNLKNTVLDVYRQLGIHNSLVKSEKKSTLNKKIAVGIYICSYKKLFNDIIITPLPLIISCNLVTHEINVETKIVIISNLTNKQEGVEYINCAYNEFPIRFRKVIEKIKSGKKLQNSEGFLINWFENLEKDKNYEIMVTADEKLEKIIKGITNKDIKNNYNTKTGYISKMWIDSSLKYDVEFKKYYNIDFLRIRVNNDVPDYIPCEDETNEKFQNISGVYEFDKVYYSQDVRPFSEDKIFKFSNTKLTDNSAFLHRNIIEIYPIYISNDIKKLDCVKDIHNLRSASIQYEAAKTILPMPLHLGKLLEEYFI